jgi:argininosuccinate synthase
MLKKPFWFYYWGKGNKKMQKKIVLAYSGGLDTSIAIGWLREKGFLVYAYLADVGQPMNKSKIQKRALDCGAKKVIIEDLKKEFVDDYIIPALKANAVYEEKYFLGTALSRPLIAKGMVKVAKKLGAKYVAHGCTGKGNDQVRFEMAFASFAPYLQVIAPAREWDFKSREEQIDYAKKHHIPIEATRKNPYSVDRNLWGVSIECGLLEDPQNAPPPDAYILTKDPEKATAKIVQIHFKKGMPTKLNQKRMKISSLIDKLNKIGGECGIGRSDLVEDRFVGIKSREVYEAPAANILTFAHKELEALTLDKETMHFKKMLEQKYAQLIYNGFWFTPLKEALDAFINKTQAFVTGEVKLKLYKGHIIILSRKSKFSLYSKKLATYGKGDIFDRKAATGFIKILGLPYKLTGKRNR